MKRISIKIVALILAFGCILTTGAFASYDVTQALAVDDGELALASAQAALNAYFGARGDVINEPISLMSADDAVLPVSAEVAADISLRAENLRDFWANEDVAIVSTIVTDHVISATQHARSANIDAVVYEWTWLDYIDSDCGIVDRMGFATIHDMTLAPENGADFVVVRDSYDEADISGHTSADYDAEQFAQATVDINTSPIYDAITEEEEASPHSLPETALAAQLTGNATNVLASITYADTYVKKDIAGTAGSQAVAFYNTAVYGQPPDSDCANYVSQCLYAGGLRDANGSQSSGWWHKRDGTATCSEAWWGVDKFVTFWRGKGYSTPSVSNGVIPGNPVYYYGTGGASNHIVLCVGYNSAGNPIINGHTRDAYHQKMDSIYTNTVNFNTASVFVSTPAYATNIAMPGSLTRGPLLQAEKIEWFKFTPSTSGYHSVYSTGNTNTLGILYQETYAGAGGTVYLYELTRNDDSAFTNEGTNFRMGATLTAGKTYYFSVQGGTSTASGSFGLVLQKG